jgi:hypothetical protein
MLGLSSGGAPQFAVTVRKTVWLIFCAAALLALALPTATLLHQRWLSLQATATVWPARPQVGAVTHLIVSLANTSDQASVEGPWAEVVARWNMPAMAMVTRQARLQGAQDAQGTFVIPLQLDMAGTWSVHVMLLTPGRPTWYGTVNLVASPSTGAASPSAAAT